jgi:tetratricopeptide (TPR) repeat protein
MGSLALLLLWPAIRAGDDPKDKPPTPAEQYEALVKEYQQAQQDYMKEMRAAKTAEERQKIVQEKFPKFDGFLELAKKAPKDPAALDALIWIVQMGPASKEASEATDILIKDHVQSPKMAQVCLSPGMRYGRTPASEKLLRAVLENNPDPEAKGLACYVLAFRQESQAQIAENQKQAEKAAELHKEADKLYERLAKDFSTVKAVLTQVLDANSMAPVKVLRMMVENAPSRELKGQGYYAIALRLKQDAENATEKDKAEEATKLTREAEDTFERVNKEFADVAGNRGKLGDLTKRQLFEIRHLSIGREVPEIDGEDIDGKKFKLSDYRGKVLLLDFWGNW